MPLASLPQRLATLLMAAADGDPTGTLSHPGGRDGGARSALCGRAFQRKLAVSRLPITVESATDSSRDKELAEAVRILVKGAGFRALLKDLLDAIGKGYSVVEILWATGNGGSRSSTSGAIPASSVRPDQPPRDSPAR